MLTRIFYKTNSAERNTNKICCKRKYMISQTSAAISLFFLVCLIVRASEAVLIGDRGYLFWENYNNVFEEY